MGSFSPMRSAISRYPIYFLPDIAFRARQILVGKTNTQVRWAQSIADDWVGAYFDENDPDPTDCDGEVSHETDPYARDYVDDSEHATDGLSVHDLGAPNGSFKHIPTWLNTSHVEALEACLDWFFDPTQKQYVDWKAEHFFACVALMCVEQAEAQLEGVSDHIRDDRSYGRMVSANKALADRDGYRYRHDLTSKLQNAYSWAFEATEALRIADRRIANSEKRQLQHGISLTVDRAKTEVEQSERLRRQAGAKTALIKRHEKTSEARNLVCVEWEKDRNKFPSAEQAGDFFSDWLQTKGFHFRQRTVRDWIRAFGKAQGVTFR